MGQQDRSARRAPCTAPASLNWRVAGWVLLVVGIILLAWMLRLYRLGAQSFWYDEGYAVYVAGLGPTETLYWSSRDFVPPLHSYLLALWLPLGGWGEFSARFLSAWTGTFAVAVLARMGKDLHSRQAGLLTGLLAALSPFYVWHSQNARMYMPQALFGLLATLFLIRALRRPERWWRWAGLALLDASALYAQATGTFLVAFHALVILASGLGRARRLRLVRGGLALVGALALWLPWVVYALPFLGANAGYWPGRLNWQFVLSGAFQGFVTGELIEETAAQGVLVVWGVACLIGMFVLLVPRNRGWKTALFLLAYFGVPVALMAWLFRDVPKFSPRYLIVASPPVFLLPAIGGATLLRRSGSLVGARRAVGVLVLTALFVTAVPGLGNLYFNPAFARSDFRTAARVVEERMVPDEVVLLVPGHAFPVWQLYFGPEGWVALPDDPVLDVTHVLHYRNTVEQLNPALAGRPGVWLVEWDPRVVDPTGLVPYLLEQVGEETPLAEEPVGLQLRHYRLHTGRLLLPPDPAVSPPLDSSLGLPLNLLGCALPEAVRGDETVQVACYWEAEDTLPHHLSVSARLLDAAGVEWGRADTAISGAHLVAGRWPLDEPVFGQYPLAPIPGIPPGDFYHLQLLVYEPDTTQHGVATVGPLLVERPSNPFTDTLASSQVSPASLGGLLLEEVAIRPERVLPGEEMRVEAIWQVVGPFREPRFALQGSADEYPLLPQPGATAAWEVGDRYRTISRVPVSPYALGGPMVLRAVSEDGEITLGTVHVDVTRTFTLPAGVQPLDYRLGDAVALVGAQLSVEIGDAGGVVEVVLYWRAEAIVEQSHTVFVHLVGPDGQVYAQADSLPQAGRHPTTHWLPGEVVPDPYRLELSTDTPPGAYRVLVGLYDPATLDRLPVTDAQGEPVPDDAIPIGEFQVQQNER